MQLQKNLRGQIKQYWAYDSTVQNITWHSTNMTSMSSVELSKV